MGEVTKIAWTDHTFNPWIGCSKVAAGCVNCYAEADFDNRRHVAKWGVNGTRIVTTDSYWAKPLKWNRDSVRSYEMAQGQWVQDCCVGTKNYPEPTPEQFRTRVFCASLADVFEEWKQPVLDSKGRQQFIHADGTRSVESHGRQVSLCDLRRELFCLIDATPNLDWQILTKRPENVRAMWPEETDYHDEPPREPYKFRRWRPNVWIGTSVSDQKTHDENVIHLRACRDLAGVLFLSLEPMLGPVVLDLEGIDWVIVGGESGANARPCDVRWIESIVEQCEAAGVPVFVKQIGSKATGGRDGLDWNLLTVHPKGGDPAEWEAGLRVQQFPKTRA